MRDDSPRHIPLARRHQAVFRAVRHPIDWESKGPVANERAVRSDLRDEISTKFVADLLAAVDSPADLFLSPEQCLRDNFIGRPLSPLAQATIDYVITSGLQSAQDRREAVVCAIVHANADRSESNVRAAEAALAGRVSSRDLRAFLQRYRAATEDRARLEALVREHLGLPERPDTPPPPTGLTFDLDMNIGVSA